MAKLLVPLVVLGAVAGGPPRCPPRCLCPAAAPSPTLLCARTGLLAVPPLLDRGAVELRLADNFIGAVGRSDFANMSSLVHLTLSRNGLRRLAPGAFADLRALRALHLDGNRLPALSGAQLRGLANLRHLILANNQLAAIEPAAFAAFAATVEDLDLSHNNLPALPWDAVASMASLATLTLDHNLLERIPAGTVARLPRLARLDLTANRLRALPPVPGPPGPTLAAGGNPLHCNCELLWLRRLAQPDRLESCASPAPLAGRLLWAVPEEELTCSAPAIAAAAAHPPAVIEGQPLTLACAAGGDPPPALHWLGPDGRLVQNGSRRAVGHDGTLELRVATLGDHGAFTCVASNAAGEAAARVAVAVLPLPVPHGDAGDDGAGGAAAVGPGASDMAQAGGNETRAPGERRVVAAEVTAASARIRWLPQRHVPGVRVFQIQYNSSGDEAPVYRLLPPSRRSFTLRDLAAGREYELCVAALRGGGGPAAALAHPVGCVRFSTAAAGSASAPGCAALPRAPFLGGTAVIAIGAAIAASVLLFILILILTARYKAAARRGPVLASACSQTNGAPRSPEPEPDPHPEPRPEPDPHPEPPAVAPPLGSGSHSFPRRNRTRRHGSLPRLDQGGDAAPALRPSFGSTHWMLESTV
ncbi:leucine-rich repeat and fibronectin type III domain-containing protein 1 [Pezoporus wallicus]|uniref:leucine-rich repeat and fibronectin type III domain-containing protein 1 n=1 Tax=Pezoporus wallicus TaxID=35540 RepID=UPI002551B503|nr:leucine-rich repeat and fibronectin type III domain-containing protein 1 [Pezoporus wallicus]XP_057255847.1 leucine-rich repeat and fibronectin type III domain-containing protein 1 [Pezoporus wallicus]XP_061300411.1 leucine-rich repeat and fibronectin type III domain-containing protein 1 [Pezoporus flaviventris]